MGSQKIRNAYINTLLELAKDNKNICVLDADLMTAHGTKIFKDTYPDQYFNVGVAEANMVGVAAGLSVEGKIPFAATFAPFASRRVFDQFFISANYAHLNVKLVGTDPGISAEFNGGTHMPFEDVGMMKLIPNLIVVEPSDPISCSQLVKQIAEHYGSVYLRLQRRKSEEIYKENDTFTLGKGKVVQDGNDITLIASGYIMVSEAIKAAKILEEQNISTAVIDMHTIKPIDSELILKYAKKTNAIVTCENHQITGGLGGSVAEVLSENYPTYLGRVGVKDRFGQVGLTDFLIKEYNLTAEDIVKEAKKTLQKKKDK